MRQPMFFVPRLIILLAQKFVSEYYAISEKNKEKNCRENIKLYANNGLNNRRDRFNLLLTYVL